MTTTVPLTGEQHLPWHADPYARALESGRGPLFLRRADGWLLPLEVERWCAGADEADLSVLRRCTDTVIDLGCGPGRLVAALARLGRTALGVDSAPAAVHRARALGGAAVCRSVFDALPDEGRWGSALLMDGNIGIGGDVAALLDRVGALLGPSGVLLAEAAGCEVDEQVEVRLQDADGVFGPPFRWARLGAAALRRRARAAGWHVLEEWTCGDRRFLSLCPVRDGTSAAGPRGAVVRLRR
ncbi:class I SAM-dependent methyltransferase [Streptomyces chumphonensis]|uniref:Class I SAM-dependent methyltransferase n=1 Tax=Streptomyces chumphonensis TaxID=1214925 RepID=A0A927IAB8_9ACTN|nr:class I SAM-dependent methyltransferase [Streptomyces chumphonensis]MBD3931093.1 class I SAM-dependent methyltransferase [Streptomyces chumphonensis]